MLYKFKYMLTAKMRKRLFLSKKQLIAHKTSPGPFLKAKKIIDANLEFLILKRRLAKARSENVSSEQQSIKLNKRPRKTLKQLKMTRMFKIIKRQPLKEG